MEKLLIIVKLIPAIIELIKALESAIPGQGQGELKLAALRQILEVTDSTFTQLWPTIESIVGVLVKVFNSTSTFKAG